MIIKIRKIGNSNGIIIPKAFLKELRSPAEVDVALVDEGIIIRPPVERIFRRKPRDKDEATGLSSLASARIKKNIETGKIRWIGEREMERKIEV